MIYDPFEFSRWLGCDYPFYPPVNPIRTSAAALRWAVAAASLILIPSLWAAF